MDFDSEKFSSQFSEKNGEARLIENYPFLFVDGGIKHLAKFDFSQANLEDRNPIDEKKGLWLSVGDGDSADVAPEIYLPEEKDFSDLSFALSLIPDSFCNINLLGFLGGRRDHELINFGEVHQYLKKRSSSTEVSFDFGQVLAFSQHSFVKEIDGVFSTIVLEQSQLKISGDCEYQLQEKTELAPASSLGLSNVGSGDVTFEANSPFFIFR